MGAHCTTTIASAVTVVLDTLVLVSRTEKIVLVLNGKVLVLVMTVSPQVKSRLFYLFSDGTSSVHSLHFIEHDSFEMSLYLIQLQFEDLW